MKTNLEEFTGLVEELAFATVMLDAQDIPALGNVLNMLESIYDLVGVIGDDKALRLAIEEMKNRIEQAIMGEDAGCLSHFEEMVTCLQEICRSLDKGKSVEKTAAHLLGLLKTEVGKESRTPAGSEQDPSLGEAFAPEDSEKDSSPKAPSPAQPINDEDREILDDFVAESMENLSAIEVSVMDLEQDPSDLETINAIFRPFHTVKGVSGFLNFDRINKLAHTVENLLDKSRNRELHINEAMIDIVLDSVDLLRTMIRNVSESLNTGMVSEGEVEIQPIITRVEAFIDRYGFQEKKPIGEMLLSQGIVNSRDIEDALAAQKDDANRKIGEILVSDKKVDSRKVVSALREQKRYSETNALHVKVDTGKLDSIVDMVGELAIAQSMLRQSAAIKNSNDRKLYQIANQLNLITSGLQKTAMSLRMVPIKNTFQKMLRIVRDLAKKAGKEVRLVMSGEDTEIDRNMVEEIYEPMVHMVRNSIDHGLETPAERLKIQKDPQGTIFLRAFHKGGDIVIEIEDDGRGLNKEKIRRKALKSGLIKEGEKHGDADIHQLIFEPGFSTADQVTEISGRGVGTDVVKSKIERLRGRVEVKSVPGKGVCFTMRLPLTLAIVDGMIVKVNDERYVIPTLSVQEFFKPRKEDYFTVKKKGEMIKVREDLIPLIRIEKLLGANGRPSTGKENKKPWEKLVAVVEYQGKCKCLLVDELVGQEEVVIKSLGGWLKQVRGLAGGAIMGDGRVGLILDVSGLFDIVSED